MQNIVIALAVLSIYVAAAMWGGRTHRMNGSTVPLAESNRQYEQFRDDRIDAMLVAEFGPEKAAEMKAQWVQAELDAWEDS